MALSYKRRGQRGCHHSGNVHILLAAIAEACNGCVPCCRGHEANKRGFIATMDAVDREMQAAGGPFFLGKELSLVDVVFSPFLERIAASIYYYKGFVVRGEGRWANIERWFEAMEQRPAYLGTRSDYFTHVHDLPPQLGGAYIKLPC